MFYYVYKITNTINNKFYIGSHKTQDLNDDYFGSGLYLKRAIKKYSKENFRKEILHYLKSIEEMYAKETEVLQQHRNDPTYNLKFYSMGGNTREKYNKKQKKEYIKKLITNPNSPIGKRGKKHWNYNKQLPEKQKMAMSKSQKERMKRLKGDPIAWQKWKEANKPSAVKQCLINAEKKCRPIKATYLKTGEEKTFKSITECYTYYAKILGNKSKYLRIHQFINKQRSDFKKLTRKRKYFTEEVTLNWL
jgi:hypothetical protein